MKESNTIRIALYIILLAMALVVVGCVEKQSKSGSFIGETKSLGNGTVRSWITLGDDGNASAIGVTFTEMALSGLPTENSTEYMLALPEQASATPFNHVGICLLYTSPSPRD